MDLLLPLVYLFKLFLQELYFVIQLNYFSNLRGSLSFLRGKFVHVAVLLYFQVVQLSPLQLILLPESLQLLLILRDCLQ